MDVREALDNPHFDPLQQTTAVPCWPPEASQGPIEYASSEWFCSSRPQAPKKPPECPARRFCRHENDDFPSYWIRDGICEDRRLWRLWRIERALGIKSHKHPRVKATGSAVAAMFMTPEDAEYERNVGVEGEPDPSIYARPEAGEAPNAA